ncbi:mediator of RNA polymerase II transcription subunit 21-like isoform X1 [Nilaparvata lugens]|uniref:mediator of RNA polymerase II transcription subunit 21-like isoform X1 n=1 Tax=Nilaparvata lugens TaxID=108931 RepID=UPI000B983832|nr:mediator of RNA polymerase II transcription subunit 21-like isoform X1 [Nilaparvata lugens]
MSDRITQLQDLVSRLSCTFSESLGVIGQFSEPQKFPEMEELKRLRAEKRRLRAEQKKRKQVVSDLPMNQKKVLENSQHVNYSADFAKVIVQLSTHIDTIVDTLPDPFLSSELQARSLEVLQEENEEAAEKLDELLNTGEKLLKKIREARSFLSNGYLEAMSAK